MLSFTWCNDIPEFWARVFIIMAFYIPFFFALTMKKSYFYKGAESKRKWRDLRYWILILVLVQTAIYAYF